MCGERERERERERKRERERERERERRREGARTEMHRYIRANTHIYAHKHTGKCGAYLTYATHAAEITSMHDMRKIDHVVCTDTTTYIHTCSVYMTCITNVASGTHVTRIESFRTYVPSNHSKSSGNATPTGAKSLILQSTHHQQTET